MGLCVVGFALSLVGLCWVGYLVIFLEFDCFTLSLVFVCCTCYFGCLIWFVGLICVWYLVGW